jgi:steroid delta-isomerase-like uncharacterized protein
MSDAAAIAREYLETWNRRDWDHYREMMHSGYSYTGGDGQKQSGADAGVAVGQMFANAFPDGKIDIQKVVAAGDTAVVEFIGQGTHNGDLMGVPPTGRTISIPVCDVLEIKDGKIFSEHEYIDIMTMMQQLGVVPAPATA